MFGLRPASLPGRHPQDRATGPGRPRSKWHDHMPSHLCVGALLVLALVVGRIGGIRGICLRLLVLALALVVGTIR
jgi:hypothetical protein